MSPKMCKVNRTEQNEQTNVYIITIGDLHTMCGFSIFSLIFKTVIFKILLKRLLLYFLLYFNTF